MLSIYGKGDDIKLKKLEDEGAALLLASTLEENAFDVYLWLSTDDRKDIARIKLELRKQYESGNRNREDTLYLLVRLAYLDFADAHRNIHEKDVFV